MVDHRPIQNYNMVPCCTMVMVGMVYYILQNVVESLSRYFFIHACMEINIKILPFYTNVHVIILKCQSWQNVCLSRGSWGFSTVIFGRHDLPIIIELSMWGGQYCWCGSTYMIDSVGGRETKTFQYIISTLQQTLIDSFA